MKYTILGDQFAPKFSLPFMEKFEVKDLAKIDLSVTNDELKHAKTGTVDELDAFVNARIRALHVRGVYGGYAEKRAIYQRSSVFEATEGFRNIHLGVDFWLPAGTRIAAPMPGVVHSIADNDASGDYGPTIVLSHAIGNETIHSLYGHLSRISLLNISVGQLIKRGDLIGTLGEPKENKDWPPHLHFQLIRDMEGKMGDYPGVCAESEKAHYLENCPNPIVFFGWDLH